MDTRVKDLWRIGTGWLLDRILPYISMNTHLELSAVVLDSVTGARDMISWSGEADGRFSVKSAYGLLTRDDTPRPDMGALFGRVWRIKVPERVRVFFWLLGNQAIMTNEERHRRHLCASDLCEVCKGGVESAMHILRDCPTMEGIWLRIVPPRKRHEFFKKSLFEWVYGNLGDDAVVDGVPWSVMFAMGVWWGWKWRCGNVFGENRKCRDRVQFVKNVAKEVFQAHGSRAGNDRGRNRVERLIGWGSPGVGWVKLNTDGASRGNPGLATAGGVLRDEEGNWRGGFAANIGRCSAPLAELWEVYYGLYFAWAIRIPQLELEVDSEIVVGFLKTGISDTHPLFFLVRLCYGFLSKDWRVQITHVYREANHLNGLANYAFSLPSDLHFYDLCRDGLSSCLSDDARGAVYPRRVLL